MPDWLSAVANAAVNPTALRAEFTVNVIQAHLNNTFKPAISASASLVMTDKPSGSRIDATMTAGSMTRPSLTEANAKMPGLSTGSSVFNKAERSELGSCNLLRTASTMAMTFPARRRSRQPRVARTARREGSTCTKPWAGIKANTLTSKPLASAVGTTITKSAERKRHAVRPQLYPLGRNCPRRL